VNAHMPELLNQLITLVLFGVATTAVVWLLVYYLSDKRQSRLLLKDMARRLPVEKLIDLECKAAGLQQQNKTLRHRVLGSSGECDTTSQQRTTASNDAREGAIRIRP